MEQACSANKNFTDKRKVISEDISRKVCLKM